MNQLISLYRSQLDQDLDLYKQALKQWSKLYTLLKTKKLSTIEISSSIDIPLTIEVHYHIIPPSVLSADTLDFNAVQINQEKSLYYYT